VGVNVAGIAVAEFGSKLVGETDHRLGVGSDAAAMKGRLCKTALAEPGVTLAGKKAVTKEAFVGLENAPLREFPRLTDEDFFDERGIADEEDVIVEGTEHDDVAVFPLEPGQIFKGVAAVLAIEAGPGVVGWSRGNFGGQLGLHELMLSGR